MLATDYIRCHGSGNRFLLLDAVAEPRLEEVVGHAGLVRRLCTVDGPADGLLLIVRRDGDYGMRMFNTDGSEAEMCGNGIRCVARAVAERYLPDADRFALRSGGRSYAVRREEPIFDGIPTYRVGLPVRLSTDDFPPSLARGAAGFVGERIGALDPALRFTYLNPGNPHLAAAVEAIDTRLLLRLGERVKELRDLFPRGINVSLFVHRGGQSIYTATCERGVGLTSSCGTAMTACSTAACLLRLCRPGEPIDVGNDGGLVRCLCRCDEAGITTFLSGNATFEADGRLGIDPAAGLVGLLAPATPRAGEIDRYRLFHESVQRITHR